jgi:CRISPR system Cascade subunit CasD
VPTELIGQGVDADLDSALEHANQIAADDERQVRRMPVFKVLQGEHEGDEVLTLNDVPLQFGPHKQYRDRRVTVIRYV